MKFTTKIGLAFTALFALSITQLNAQDAPEAVMSAQELQAAKEFIETQRNLTVIQNLPLTREEADKFWPLYEEYRIRVRALDGSRLSVIESYAERYRAGTVDDEFAEEAMEDALKINLNKAKLQKRYWSKFKRILPGTKAGRFYQLESKMDAEVDFVLAGGIPLLESE